MDGTGNVSGTPTAGGDSSTTATVTDSASTPNVVTASITFNIAAPVQNPVMDPANGLPLYIPDASTTVGAPYTPVTDVAGPNNEVLYNSSNDVVGQPPSGVTAGWSLFEGGLTTTPVPVPAADVPPPPA